MTRPWIVTFALLFVAGLLLVDGPAWAANDPGGTTVEKSEQQIQVFKRKRGEEPAATGKEGHQLRGEDVLRV